MFKKIGRRFVSYTMGITVIVLGILMAIINIGNYSRVNKNIDTVITFIAENNGDFSDFKPNDNEQIGFFDNRYNPMNPETPYETRFFVVVYTPSAIKVDTNNVASISDDEAINYATLANNKSKTKGYIDNYRYLKTTDKSGNQMFVFVDASRVISTAESFLKASIVVSLAFYIITSIVLYFVSKKVVKQALASYESQKKFITNASHELKTPLTIISANNELIAIENGESEYTEAINKQIDRMNSMVKSLTALAKIEESPSLNKFENISLTELCENSLYVFKPAFIKKNINLESSIDENINIKGDGPCISKLISILIENSLKYTKSWFKLSLYKEGKNIVLLAINDASNVEAGIHKEYFDRFYRSAESRASSTEGSGIGLSIAKDIVSLHKGKIYAIGTKDNEFMIKVIF